MTFDIFDISKFLNINFKIFAIFIDDCWKFPPTFHDPFSTCLGGVAQPTLLRANDDDFVKLADVENCHLGESAAFPQIDKESCEGEGVDTWQNAPA